MRISTCVRYSTIAWLAAFGLAAAEHHGLVKFGGLPVPGATVTATQSDKKLVAVTDQQGAYSFPDLADGTWTIQVEMLCFSTIRQEVGVAPGAPGPEWELKLLPLDEMKAVAPAPFPPGSSTPATTASGNPATGQGAAAERGGSRGAKAGGAPAPAGAQTGFQRTDVNASSDAGKRESESGALGSEGGGLAPGDLTQTASDAFIVSGSVSSGIERRAIGNARRGPGSMFRGDLSSTADNSALDARPFSLTGQNTPKPAYNRLRFGASFGGPLIIPRLVRGNGQFFINYQMMRSRNATTQSTLMPTLLERNGDLSQTLNPLGQPVQIFDPATGLPFAGNVIPQNRISPQAKTLLGFYPQPNFDAAARYNYQVPIVGVTDLDAVQTRLNKTLDSNNYLNGGWAYQNSRGASPNLFGFLDTTGGAGLNANINWRHVFSKMISGSLGYQFSRMAARTTPYFANRENVSGEAGITGNNQEPGNWGPPNLSFAGGMAGLSDAQQAFTRNQTSALSYSLLWIHRPHNVTIGGDFRRLQFNTLAQQDARGSFAFTGAATQGSANGAAVPGTGSDFAGFLLGIPDTSSIAFGNADKYFRTSSYDAYFTDDWRVGPGFTVNAGMRWEYSSPITERYGRLVNLDIAPGFVAQAPVVARNPVGALTGRSYPDSLVQPDKHAVQPRVGIAWHPLLASSMVVRAGYGVTYDTSVYQSIASQMAQQSPLSKSLSVQNSPGNPLTLASGFNASPTITPNTFAIDPDFRIGYAQNWQLSVQSDLPAALQLTATYLGAKGTRARQVFLPNTYPTGAPNLCPTCPAGYAYQTSNGNSTREAGQIQLRRRLHNGVTASVQYTFAKAIDDAALGGRGQGGSVIAQNWLDLSGERGLSGFDQRHRAAVQAQYTTGMGVRGGTLLRGWEGALFKGWTFVTQITAGTGLPLTPIYVAAVKGTGVTGSIRPDYTGAPVYAAPSGRFLNPAAYAAPAPGHWGNAGRNSITGPAQFVLNASMARSFDNIDFRIDSTNPLNHVTFPSWNTTVTSGQFGLPSQANAMRSLEATLRWRF
jgi:hypothetical protein